MILESSQEHFVCFVKAKPLLQSFNRDLETYLFIVHFKFLILKKIVYCMLFLGFILFLNPRYSLVYLKNTAY